MVTPQTISSWQTTCSCRGPVRKGAWSGSAVPGELLALCVRDKDVGPEEDLGGYRDAEATAESRADRGRRDDGGEQGDRQPAGGGGGAGTERDKESPNRSGDATVLDVPLAFVAVQRRPGSERASGHRGRENVIHVDAEPPVGRHPLYPSAPNRGTPDGCGRVGNGKEESSRTGQACGCGCPSGSFALSQKWVGGLQSACNAVSGMRG